MLKNGFVKISGNSSNIKEELNKNVVLNRPQADILFERIQENKNLLSDGECFTTLPFNTSKNNGYYNFITYDASYFINVKYLTLALLCLLFDIKMSNGFASLILNMIGINCEVIELDDTEKCVAYKIKTEKRISFEQLVPLIQCNFIGKNDKCGHYRRDCTCEIWTKDTIQTSIDSLESKKIIKKNGDMYEIIF